MAHPCTLDPASRDSYADVLHALLAKGTKEKGYGAELIIRYTIPREKVVAMNRRSQVKAVKEALSAVEKPLAFLARRTSAFSSP